MDDLISRQDAIDAVGNMLRRKFGVGGDLAEITIAGLPSAQPDIDEWCHDCKEYDKERHCCPRWNRVIRQTLKDAQPEPKWIPCSSQLPELDVYVIATTQWYEITMACRIGDGEWFIHEDNANAYDDDILAWMPLPEPYRP